MTEFAVRPLEYEPTPNSRQIRLITNSFKLKIQIAMYQYSVKFEPDLDQTKERRMREGIVNRITRENFSPTIVVYDNTTLYSFGRVLDKTHFQVDRKKDQVETQFNITFDLVNSFTPDRMDYPYQWLNILFKRIQQQKGLLQIKRNMLNPNNRRNVPGTNLELWDGTSFVVYGTMSGAKMVADKVHGILRTDTVLDFWRKNAKFNIESAKEDLKGQHIVTKYGGRYVTYRIESIDELNTPRTLKFERKMEGGQKKEESVQDYFASRYKINLQSNQPLLICKPTGRGGSNTAAIPMEVAYSTGIPEEIRRDAQTMRTIKQMHESAPNERKRMIDQVTRSMLEYPELAQAGVVPDGLGMVTVQGRVCPPISLIWGSNKEYYVQEGAFRDATKTNTLFRPIPLVNWVVICTQRDTQNIENFLQALQKVAKGVRIEKPKLIVLGKFKPNEYIDEFSQQFTKQYMGMQMALFLLPDKNEQRYRGIKKLIEIERPVPSQCILSINAMKANLSVLTGLWTQMTQKLGGICWRIPAPRWIGRIQEQSRTGSAALQIRAKPQTGEEWQSMMILQQKQVTDPNGIMLVGIDVSRSKLSKSGSVALCASYNSELTLYHQRSIECPPRKEIVEQHFDKFMLESLKTFYSYPPNQKKLPSYIFLYRDGVGDSMLPDALKIEYPQFLEGIKQAGKELGLQDEYKPFHAVIIVDKRISHRIFAEQGANFINPPPGTVVGGWGADARPMPIPGKQQASSSSSSSSSSAAMASALAAQLQKEVDAQQEAQKGGGKGKRKDKRQKGKRGKGDEQGQDDEEDIHLTTTQGEADGGGFAPVGNQGAGGITSPTLYDFYLVPQAVAVATTALPVRFVVLVDKSGLSAPEIEDFTNALCYIYANYFGSISLPLPVQMAHKLSIHTQEVLDNGLSKMPNVSYQL
ncbi:MAG: putative piwi-like protein [Streblomastix strix]|uniref:Putative piwi-like protein n=1 Tax=Streblomastix strix TaxID=222440 RepID=A0A5J4WWT6_9EUKA|nr:MAG: putative piwi-like protein [Streblomastix strix]